MPVDQMSHEGIAATMCTLQEAQSSLHCQPEPADALGRGHFVRMLFLTFLRLAVPLTIHPDGDSQ